MKQTVDIHWQSRTTRKTVEKLSHNLASQDRKGLRYLAIKTAESFIAQLNPRAMPALCIRQAKQTRHYTASDRLTTQPNVEARIAKHPICCR